ncbi:MAG: hypothetical protein JWO85_1651, partial [Candidatus Eremiobacteraeota bacterium]|nr:hypothetical protein [Candidatus Eremiobacteraeota bacterium]
MAAKTNWLVQIFDATGKLVDIPQSDILTLQLSDGINGGSGAGGSDQIVFARPYNKIGAIGFLYQVLFWMWPAGTTRPTDPYWGGYIVDFDQLEEDASGKVTAYLFGDFKRLDAAIVTEQINPGVGGNPTLDASPYINHLLTTYQPTTFSAPTIPASMFALQAMQFDATQLGAAVDTITKTGRDTSGLFFTWAVRTKADLTRRVVIQSDQNPNVVAGVNFKALFRGAQIREYKIATKYRDIKNVIAVYGGKDPTTGAQAYGAYQDAASVSQFTPWQEKLSVPTLLTSAACQAYATVFFPLHAYPQAQSAFKILVPDNAIFGGTWLQINEVPQTASQAAVYKQVRCAMVRISVSGERVVQYVETVAPVPYLDVAVYRMGLNVTAAMATIVKGLPVNRQSLYVRAGGTVTSTLNNPARVAISATEAVFPSGLVKAAALATTQLTDNSGGALNGQTGDGAYTVSLTSAGAYVITKGARPAETPTQLNLVSAVVLSASSPQDTVLITDIRTLVALPTFDISVAPALAGGTTPTLPTPANAGAGAYDQNVGFQLASTWTLGNAALAYLELGWAATGNNPTPATKIEPTATGVYAGVVPGIGAGQSVTIYVRAVDTNDRPTPWLGLGVTGVNPMGVGATNFGSHPTPTFFSSNLNAATAQNSVHAQVAVKVTLTGVPTDGSVSGLAYYYRLHGAGNFKPIGEMQIVQGSATQLVPATGAFTFEVGAGQNIDVFIGYVGVASADYGPLVQIGTAGQIASGFTPATLVVQTGYMAANAVAPSVSGTSFTAVPSADGIQGGMTIGFTVGNQPQDGSLSKLALWRRVTGATTNWDKITDLPAAGLPSPSLSQAYVYTVYDLTNGSQYDWGVAYEDAQGGEVPAPPVGTAADTRFGSAAAGLIGTSPAATIVIGTAAFAAMPAGILSAGPTLRTTALTGATTAGANTVIPVTAGTGTFFQGGTVQINPTGIGSGNTEYAKIVGVAANSVTVTATTLNHSAGELIAVCEYQTATTPGAGVSNFPIYLQVAASDYGGSYGTVPNWLDDLVVVLRKSVTHEPLGDSEVIAPSTQGQYAFTVAIPAGAGPIDVGYYYKGHKGYEVSTTVFPSQLAGLSAVSLSTANFVADSAFAHGLGSWKQVGTPTLALYPANNANTGNPAPFVGSPGVGSGWTGCLYSAPFTPVAFATYCLSAAVGFTGSGTMHVAIVDVSDYNAGNVTPATIYGNSPDASGRLIPNPTSGVYVSGGYGGSAAPYVWTASGSPPSKVCFAWWWSGASNAFSLAEPQIKGGASFSGYTPGALTTNTTDGTGTTTYQGTAKQVTSIIKDDGTGTGNGSIPKSTALNKQGSIPPVGTPAASSVSTAGGGSNNRTITISVAATTFLLPDGSTPSAPSFSDPRIGLLDSTTYLFTVAYNIGLGVFQTLAFGTSLTAAQKAAIYGDGFYPVTNTGSCTTPTAAGTGGGSGGGGGGGSCPAVDQLVLTKEHGPTRAGDIIADMHVMGPDGKWKRVIHTSTQHGDIVR